MKKKLYKIKNGKKFEGVCLGLSDYLNLDVTIIRIIVALLTLFNPIIIIIYIICAIIMPAKDDIDFINNI